MKISEQWLREWVDPPVDTDTLVGQLTMAGLEVDRVEPAAPELEGVVVGRVLEKRPHPNADRLSVCRVDVGSGEPLQIVCGAANVCAGGVFPVATVGATLPGGLKIRKTKLRGEASHGMLCSGVELGIAEVADGLLELDPELVPGTPLSEALQLDDRIIDIDLTPNRADCFCVLGVARDLAAFNELEFSEPSVSAVAPAIDEVYPVGVDAAAGCPAFAARVIRGINPEARTPLWLAEKLRRAGIRPLHPVVDVTNFVMLELGQPMHAYDLEQLSGKVRARSSRAGEVIRLLDGQDLTLDASTLVIADDAGPVGLAGIMGGERSAVTGRTTSVLLESAFFAPSAMAGQARRYGLHTDAALRFERGVDYTGQVRAIERATALIMKIAGGEAGPVIDERVPEALPERHAVELRKSRLDSMLGVELAAEEVTAMLARLGFAVEELPVGWRVTPTAARFDIRIEADLVEEVARLHGYDKVPAARLTGELRLAGRSEQHVPLERATELLVARGYAEAITYSFVEPVMQGALLGEAPELALSNPISADLAVMRRSLWPGLLTAAQANRKRQQERVFLFEVGSVFSLQEKEIKEKKVISGLAVGRREPEQWSASENAAEPADFFDVKGDLDAMLALGGSLRRADYVASEHPALRPRRTARIERAGVVLGWLGELHPRHARSLGLAPAPVVFELDVGAALSAEVPRFRPVSRFPAVRRDLAVIVAEQVTAAELLETVRNTAGPILLDVRIFDVYRGNAIENGLKSVALGLILQETSRTLTEPEIEGVINAVVSGLTSKFNASIRE